MDGIYILKTVDGYRVAYSDKKDSLFGLYNNDTMNYDIDVDILDKIFGRCSILETAKIALDISSSISNSVKETDDGIMFITSYGKYTFEELLNGQATKNS